MILPEELEKIALKKQTSLLNIFRDYLQALFLFGFYQKEASKDFFFKGGTALHFIYQSPRFSEDLAFSARILNYFIFEDLLAETLSFMEKSGFSVNLEESKKTTGGCLAIFSTKISKLNISLKIEVSLRRRKEEGEAVLVRTDYLPAFDVLILKEEDLIKSKISALIARKKPRDFFDLYFLLRSNLKIDFSFKEQKNIIEELEKIEPAFLFKELREFLPASHKLIIKDLPNALKRELMNTYPSKS